MGELIDKADANDMGRPLRRCVLQSKVLAGLLYVIYSTLALPAHLRSTEPMITYD